MGEGKQRKNIPVLASEQGAEIEDHQARFQLMFQEARKYRVRLLFINQVPHLLPDDVISSANLLGTGAITSITRPLPALPDKAVINESRQRMLPASSSHQTQSICELPHAPELIDSSHSPVQETETAPEPKSAPHRNPPKIAQTWLRKARQLQGLSQAKLASKAHVSVPDLCLIESGKPPSGGWRKIMGTLHRIALCLEMDFYSLYSDDYLQLIADSFLQHVHPRFWPEALLRFDDAIQRELSPTHYWPRDICHTAPDEVEQLIERQQFIHDFQCLLEILPYREEEVLRMRYDAELTGEQVADHLGVSRARAYQIETNAIVRLRRYAKTYDLQRHLPLS